MLESDDMCCSVHLCDNSFYNQQMHTLFCRTLYRFADMFRSIWTIIRAPHTLNIIRLLHIFILYI